MSISSERILSFILYSLFLLNFENNSISSIIIIRQNPNLPKKLLPPKVKPTKLSNLCTGILGTSANLGDNPFQIYKYCKGKYDHLSANDTLIQQDQPFCFENLQNFYCLFRIFDDSPTNSTDPNAIPITDNSEPCRYNNVTKLILTTIDGCLNNEYTEINEALNQKSFANENKNQTSNICPSLNSKNYKVENKKQFCTGAVKKVINPTNDGGQETVYQNIKDTDQDDCSNIVDMYNLCIDTDYILYPNSKYKRCFNVNNDIYSCNIKKLVSDKYDQKMCSNYLIPFIASDDNAGKTSDIENYCYNYDTKIVNQYQQYIDNTTSLINEGINNLANLSNRKNSNNNLGEEDNNALNVTTTTTNIWIKFFPKFSSTFKNRKNLTSAEAIDIQKMGDIFDKAFKFTASLEDLLKNANFTNGNFEALQQKNMNNLKNIEMYFNQISDLSNSFLKLLNQNANLNMDPNNPENLGKFAENESISDEEITSFQNQFMQMLQYSKDYMSFIMTNVIQQQNIFSNVIKEQNKAIVELTKRKQLFLNKKINLQKDIMS